MSARQAESVRRVGGEDAFLRFGVALKAIVHGDAVYGSYSVWNIEAAVFRNLYRRTLQQRNLQGGF